MIKAANPDDNRDRELKRLAYFRRNQVRLAKVIFLRRLMREGALPIEVIHNELGIPEKIDRRYLGSVTMDLARDNIIRRVSYTRKRQPDSHGSPVGVWELADVAAAKELIQLIEAQQKSEAAGTDSPFYPTEGDTLNA